MKGLKNFLQLRNKLYFFSKRQVSRNILHLHERGLFATVFPDRSPQKMLDLANRATQTVYAGFDPTADSLHLGNLLVVVNLLHWMRSGHRCLVVIGGATAQIGDPSGRDTERAEINKNIINQNSNLLAKSIKKINDNHQQYFVDKEFSSIKILNNQSWFDGMKALEFISKVGKHFKVGTMVKREGVKERLSSEQDISFNEFTYQILQAYDWMYLLQKFKCKFQIGGNDQLSNMISGYDLIKKVSQQEVYGLTLPLVTNEEGNKQGKTSGNAIWLSEAKTTPFQFYQFFIRIKDSDISKYLKWFTFLPIDEINSIIMDHYNSPSKKIAQTKLAEQLTLLVHGERGLYKAKLTTAVLHDRDLNKLNCLAPTEMSEIFNGANIVELHHLPDQTILQTALKAKCFPSESDAIRIIGSGGMSINYQKVINGHAQFSKTTHVLDNNLSLIRVGKKNYTIVKWLS